MWVTEAARRRAGEPCSCSGRRDALASGQPSTRCRGRGLSKLLGIPRLLGRDVLKDGYVLDAEAKRVPVVLQYSSFDFLNDKAKAIVEAHANEAARRWGV